MKNIEKYIELSKKITESKDIDTIVNLQEKMNNLIKEHINILKVENILENLNSISFGELNEMFKNISSSLFESNKGRLLIDKYAKTINENKALSAIYTFHHTINESNKKDNVDLYIRELNDILLNDIDKNTLKEGKEKIANLIKKSINIISLDDDTFNSMIDCKSKDLHESIEYIATAKKSAKSIQSRIEKYNVIAEHIDKANNFNLTIPETEIKINEAVNKINEEYSEILNDSDSEYIRGFISGKISKSEIYEHYKSLCLSLINEMKNDENAETLQNIYEKLEKKEYHEESFNDDFSHMISLRKTLTDNE